MYVVEHGLCLTSDTTRIGPYKCRNYSSISQYRSQVLEALAPDLEHSRIFRPPVGVSSSYIHALGAVPKTADSVRVIHDLSRPIGRSLNDHMQSVGFKFQTIDDAIELMGPNCFMAKVDIEGAYRHVPIDPLDWDKLAFIHPDGYEVFDGFLCFGANFACEVFNRIRLAIKRMMARLGIRCLVVYVDDFMIIARSESEAWRAYFALRALLRSLGFSVNMKPHKTIFPSQVCNFLGVCLDSVRMEARLDDAKLANTLELLRRVLRKKAIKRRDLESVAGKLNWIARVVYGGRTFLRCIIDAVHSVSHPSHYIHITGGLRQDLQWYQDFLPQFNGKTALVSSRPLSPLLFSTDASSSSGYGAFLQGGYISLSFAAAAIHVHEIFALLIACRTWPDALSGLFLCCRIDNQVVVSAVNKGTAKGEFGPLMMTYLRELFWLSATLDFRLTARYITSKDNILADALSRDDWPCFYLHLRQFISQGVLHL